MNETQTGEIGYSHRFAQALSYAADVHQLQLRKGTAIPYIGHLLGVASIVIDAGGTEEEAIAALLHDAAEDQGGKPRLEDTRQRFGDRVAQIIEGCSDPLDHQGKTGATWEERKAAYLAHLRLCGDVSVYLVSAADKLHNARATLVDFCDIGDEIWERFSAGRTLSLQNYDNLVMTYREGPPDERRDRVVNELAAIVDTLCMGIEPERIPTI